MPCYVLLFPYRLNLLGFSVIFSHSGSPCAASSGAEGQGESTQNTGLLEGPKPVLHLPGAEAPKGAWGAKEAVTPAERLLVEAMGSAA